MSETVDIERVDHIGIRVRDLDRAALAFYRVLGFTLARRATGWHCRAGECGGGRRLWHGRTGACRNWLERERPVLRYPSEGRFARQNARSGTDGLQTRSWREMDSNLRYRARHTGTNAL